MPGPLPIVLGASIYDANGSAVGRLGAIAQNDAGGLFVVTAKHVTSANGSGEFTTEAGLRARSDSAFASDIGLDADTPSLFAEAIGALRVAGDADAPGLALGAGSPKLAHETLFDLIDCVVSVVIEGEHRELGTVISVDGRATVRSASPTAFLSPRSSVRFLAKPGHWS